jgi:hypothetical protein
MGRDVWPRSLSGFSIKLASVYRSGMRKYIRLHYARQNHGLQFSFLLYASRCVSYIGILTVAASKTVLINKSILALVYRVEVLLHVSTLWVIIRKSLHEYVTRPWFVLPICIQISAFYLFLFDLHAQSTDRTATRKRQQEDEDLQVEHNRILPLQTNKPLRMRQPNTASRMETATQ